MLLPCVLHGVLTSSYFSHSLTFTSPLALPLSETLISTLHIQNSWYSCVNWLTIRSKTILRSSQSTICSLNSLRIVDLETVTAFTRATTWQYHPLYIIFSPQFLRVISILFSTHVSFPKVLFPLCFHAENLPSFIVSLTPAMYCRPRPAHYVHFYLVI
jgi:hypothetical protein